MTEKIDRKKFQMFEKFQMTENSMKNHKQWRRVLGPTLMMKLLRHATFVCHGKQPPTLNGNIYPNTLIFRTFARENYTKLVKPTI